MEIPERVPKDPLVRLKCPRKQAGWMDLLPNISALSPIALDASFLEVLGAIPGMTVHLAHFTEHIRCYNTYSFLPTCLTPTAAWRGVMVSYGIWEHQRSKIVKIQQLQ